MRLLAITLTMLLGVAVVSTPIADQQAGSPTPMQFDGEPASAFATEPASGEALFVVAGGDLYQADRQGSWETSGTAPEGATLIVDSDNDQTLWAGSGQECYRGGGGAIPIMRSADGGTSWIEIGSEGFVPLAAWSSLGVVIAHDCSGLQLSFDGGQSWQMPDDLPLGSQVTAATMLRGPASSDGLGIAVGVTGEGGTSELYLVTVQTPDEIVVDGPVLTYYGIGSVDVREDNSLIVGAPQGVLVSDDQGQSWTVIRDGLESTTLEQDPIEFFPPDLEPGSFGLPALLAKDGVVYVGGVDGVYRLAPQGDRWGRVVALDSPVETLAIEPGTGALLVDIRDGNILRVNVNVAATPEASPISGG